MGLPFDVARAQAETTVPSICVANGRRRKMVSVIERFFSSLALELTRARLQYNVTKPVLERRHAVLSRQAMAMVTKKNLQTSLVASGHPKVKGSMALSADRFPPSDARKDSENACRRSGQDVSVCYRDGRRRGGSKLRTFCEIIVRIIRNLAVVT